MHTSSLPDSIDWPWGALKTSLMHIRSGSCAAERSPTTKASMAAVKQGPCHQAASCGSVGADTKFCPMGALAGSHWTAESLKPHAFRKGPSNDLCNQSNCHLTPGLCRSQDCQGDRKNMQAAAEPQRSVQVASKLSNWRQVEKQQLSQVLEL